MQRDHWLDGSVSECTWFGIGCDVTQSQVMSIQLAQNNLVGAFPDVLSAFPQLSTVDIYANDLSGPLPEFAAALGQSADCGHLVG